MYSIRKTDANQPAIVESLRQIPGVKVLILSEVGKGCPDICVGYKARNYLFEIKDPEQPKANKELKPDQKAFFEMWTGQVQKIESLSEILKAIGITI